MHLEMTIFQKKKTHFLDQHFLSKTIKRVFPTRRVVFPTRHFEDYTLETKGLWTCWRLLCTPDSSVWHPLWPQPFQRKWCWTVFVVESTPALQFCLIWEQLSPTKLCWMVQCLCDTNTQTCSLCWRQAGGTMYRKEEEEDWKGQMSVLSLQQAVEELALTTLSLCNNKHCGHEHLCSCDCCPQGRRDVIASRRK